uniref:NADH dehydrogenase subunit 5 n=1 Tax=Ditylenchus dipsaci TaxID=166011 RepID=A0A915DV61_9BILA
MKIYKYFLLNIALCSYAFDMFTTCLMIPFVMPPCMVAVRWGNMDSTAFNHRSFIAISFGISFSCCTWPSQFVQKQVDHLKHGFFAVLLCCASHLHSLCYTSNRSSCFKISFFETYWNAEILYITFMFFNSY